MKKVKIMLMSLLVLAVVGGALAFKAKKSSQCVFSTSSGSICTFITAITTTSNAGTAVSVKTLLESDCGNHELGEETTCDETKTTIAGS
jgi:hypothetical protein